MHFGTADLSRLPLSLRKLQADLFAALPLALPPGLHLQELDISCSRLLVDWTQLCTQVGAGQGSGPLWVNSSASCHPSTFLHPCCACCAQLEDFIIKLEVPFPPIHNVCLHS